jgi:hypothetical protein
VDSTKEKKMNKKLFVETFDVLKKQREVDWRFASYLSNAFKYAHEASLLPDNELIVNQIIKLLQFEFGDDHDESWVDYFIYELNFGEDYKDGCVRRADGSHVDLSSAEKLYDWLIELGEKNVG